MTRWWKASSGDRWGILAYRSNRPCEIILRIGLDADRLAHGMSSTRRACACSACARCRYSMPVIASMSLPANSTTTGPAGTFRNASSRCKADTGDASQMIS